MGENEPPWSWRATVWQAVSWNEGVGVFPFTLSETHKIIGCPLIIFLRLDASNGLSIFDNLIDKLSPPESD